MAGDDATERVRARLRDLFEKKRFKQNRIAERLAIQPSAVTRYVNGPTPITVSFLEAVSEESAIPIGELIAPAEGWKQVDADEAALLRHLRRWPKSVTQALVSFVAFFADEPPVELQTRNLHEYWRRMKPVDREWFYGIAVLIREGLLPPDIREGVTRQVESERKGAPAARVKRPSS